jgi:anti-sigma B factor antagonist
MAVSPNDRARPLSIDLDPDGDALTVRATGELDIATTAALEKALRDAFEGDAASIILDVAELRFIDSMGLRTLLWAAEHSRERDNRLSIRCGSGAVHRLIELTGTKRSLPLVI